MLPFESDQKSEQLTLISNLKISFGSQMQILFANQLFNNKNFSWMTLIVLIDETSIETMMFDVSKNMCVCMCVRTVWF